ncbi:hypothetical protein IJM86_07495 [bacterium]|nr:hypothetical protein [bacterium]
MNNQETSYNARWNNIEKTMQLNERVKQLKNFVVDSENQIAELLRQLEAYEKKVNSNISV